MYTTEHGTKMHKLTLNHAANDMCVPRQALSDAVGIKNLPQKNANYHQTWYKNSMYDIQHSVR